MYVFLCVYYLYAVFSVRVTKAPSKRLDTSHSFAICELILALCFIVCDDCVICHVNIM